MHAANDCTKDPLDTRRSACVAAPAMARSRARVRSALRRASASQLFEIRGSPSHNKRPAEPVL